MTLRNYNWRMKNKTARWGNILYVSIWVYLGSLACFQNNKSWNADTNFHDQIWKELEEIQSRWKSITSYSVSLFTIPSAEMVELELTGQDVYHQFHQILNIMRWIYSNDDLLVHFPWSFQASWEYPRKKVFGSCQQPSTYLLS